jgi:hypothetical protein
MSGPQKPSWEDIERAWQRPGYRPLNEFYRRLGGGWLLVGVLGVALVSAMLLAHFGFGMPVFWGRTGQRLATETETLSISLVIGGGALFFAFAGGVLYASSRKARRSKGA